LQIKKPIIDDKKKKFEITYNKNKKYNINTEGEFTPDDIREIAVSILSSETKDYFEKMRNVFDVDLFSSHHSFKSLENLKEQSKLLCKVNYFEFIDSEIISKLKDIKEDINLIIEEINTKVKSYGENISIKMFDENETKSYKLTINLTDNQIDVILSEEDDLLLDEIVEDQKELDECLKNIKNYLKEVE